MVARQNGVLEVAGSSPVTQTKKKPTTSRVVGFKSYIGFINICVQ